MKLFILDDLVNKNVIESYNYENLPETPDEKSGMREHKCLTITFNSGHILKIDTCCSGCRENTNMLFTLWEEHD